MDIETFKTDKMIKYQSQTFKNIIFYNFLYRWFHSTIKVHKNCKDDFAHYAIYDHLLCVGQRDKTNNALTSSQ